MGSLWQGRDPVQLGTGLGQIEQKRISNQGGVWPVVGTESELEPTGVKSVP